MITLPRTVHDLDTPSVLIDLDKMKANIERMQKRCDDLGLGFRPHIKTHKIPEIAQMQLEAGAVGIACQKVSEAEVFADAGIQDIQLPYNVVGPKKTTRLAKLAANHKITVSADHPDVIAGLAEAAQAAGVTIHVLVELVTEVQRTGAPVDHVIDLAKRIHIAENLRFAGILLYPSNPSMRPELQRALQLLQEKGIEVETISGGGTGAALHAAELPELTEIRVGTYVFNDMNTISKAWDTLDHCAMTIMATVVSRPTEERAILDSGQKTLSSDNIEGMYGYVVEYPRARIYQLNEEHAYVDLSRCDPRPTIGEIVHIIPVHTCVVTNLHDRLYGVRGENVELAWEVAARGRVW